MPLTQKNIDDIRTRLRAEASRALSASSPDFPDHSVRQAPPDFTIEDSTDKTEWPAGKPEAPQHLEPSRKAIDEIRTRLRAEASRAPSASSPDFPDHSVRQAPPDFTIEDSTDKTETGDCPMAIKASFFKWLGRLYQRAFRTTFLIEDVPFVTTRFSKDIVGVLERDLVKLISVYVVCHRVEEPSEAFRSAVIDNLKEGVRYRFYLSRSTYQIEKQDKRFLDYFNACINIARFETKNDIPDLFEFYELPLDWDDYPYIFYFYKYANAYNGPTARPEGTIIALRGDVKRVGIAPRYEVVDVASATTIMKMLAAIYNEASQANILGGEETKEAIVLDAEETKNIVNNVVSLDKKRNEDKKDKQKGGENSYKVL